MTREEQRQHAYRESMRWAEERTALVRLWVATPWWRLRRRARLSAAIEEAHARSLLLWAEFESLDTPQDAAWRALCRDGEKVRLDFVRAVEAAKRGMPR